MADTSAKLRSRLSLNNSNFGERRSSDPRSEEESLNFSTTPSLYQPQPSNSIAFSGTHDSTRGCRSQKRQSLQPYWDSHKGLRQFMEDRKKMSLLPSLTPDQEGRISPGKQEIIEKNDDGTITRRTITVQGQATREVTKKILTSKVNKTYLMSPDGSMKEVDSDSSINHFGEGTVSKAEFGPDGVRSVSNTVYTNGNHTNNSVSPKMLTLGDNIENQKEKSIQNFGKLQDDTELEIQNTLSKTKENFMKMLEEERNAFTDKFPALKKMRQESSLFPCESTRVLPDGTIETVRTESRQFRSMVSTYTVNGVVQKKTVQTRAFLEYQGPGGGYKLKLVAGDDDQDSETEEGDDEDSRSLAPSELRENESALINYIEGPAGTRIPQLTTAKSAGESQAKDKKLYKAWCAAKELVDTEERYVKKLHLLDQELRSRVEKASCLDKDKYQRIFSNINSLYTFHNDYLLPQLLERLREWESTELISDVIKSKAPFLKMYSEYTNNYKRATKTFYECFKKNKRFAGIVQEVEQLVDCDNLPLVSHIICPVQRVMRYHLLLQEYLKNLPENHQDKETTRQALAAVLTAANHANDMMKKMDRYKDVIEVQEMLGGQISDLVTPSRELVKKGVLTKISGRNGTEGQRFLFLFNDMLLLCSMSKLMGKYKLRAIMQIEGMQVCEGDRLDKLNTFYIRTPHRKVELYGKSEGEKNEWIKSVQGTIQEHQARKETFRAGSDSDRTPSPQSTSVSLAKTIAEKSKKCPACSLNFSPFRKEKSCKKCGAVVCGKCSNKKLSLESGKPPVRVCNGCHGRMMESQSGGGAENGSHHLSPRKSILTVKPKDEATVHSGYLDLYVNSKDGKQKTVWEKRYFAVQNDFVLYSFKTDKDSSALTALPLPGCDIGFMESKDLPEETADRTAVFKITHQKRVYFLKVGTQDEMAKWMAILELASKAEIPEEASFS